MNIKLNIDGKEYEVVSKEHKKLPKTLEELSEYTIERFRGTPPSSYLALRKLEILRDIYNDGWKADWEDGTMKYVVYFYNGKIDEASNTNTQRFLHFKTPELRGEFLKNFRGLIEEARELL